MNTLKIKAVRQFLINTELDIIVQWQEEKNIENYSLHQLAEYIVENGTDGLNIDIQNHLKSTLIKYIDEHTLIAKPFIVRDVMDYKGNLLTEDWEVVFGNLYPTIQRYDSVCYVVMYVINYNNDIDYDTNVFGDFLGAKNYFNFFKEDLKNGYPDAFIITEEDFSFQYEMEDDVRNVYMDLYLTKKPIKTL